MQDLLTIAFDTTAAIALIYLVISVALHLADCWRRCKPTVEATVLGSEQPVDDDPDFAMEWDDQSAVASFNARFGLT